MSVPVLGDAPEHNLQELASGFPHIFESPKDNKVYNKLVENWGPSIPVSDEFLEPTANQAEVEQYGAHFLLCHL